ncbi:TPA: bacteriocin ABC transporter ATP-binding protein, partial [Streptococcus pyogenes]
MTPTKVIASVQSTSDHTIVVNNLKNNKFIKKGDVIIQYSKTMENSQRKALEKQLATLNKQKNGLQILKTNLEQETNLFKGEDEFGYSDTFNHFLKQTQDIIIGFAKKNAEVNNQASLANHAISVITSQLDELHQKITDYEELKRAINNQEYKLSPENPHQTALKKYQTQFQAQEDNSALKEEYLSQISQNISELESSM